MGQEQKSEARLRDVEIQNQNVKLRYEKRLEIEDIRHKHIVEEITLMGKYKIKHFDRMEARLVKNEDKAKTPKPAD